MKAKILAVLLVGLLALPLTARADEAAKGERQEKARAYKQQQQAENKAFRATLKDLPEDQREAAVIAHRNSQFADNMTAHAKMHEEQMSKLQSKLASNTNLTEAQKQDITAKAQKEYQDNLAKAQAKHTENINYAQQVHNDPNLTPEQKRTKMKEHLESNKAEHKEHRQEMKAKREDIREEFKKRKNTTVPGTDRK